MPWRWHLVEGHDSGMTLGAAALELRWGQCPAQDQPNRTQPLMLTYAQHRRHGGSCPRDGRSLLRAVNVSSYERFTRDASVKFPMFTHDDQDA